MLYILMLSLLNEVNLDSIVHANVFYVSLIFFNMKLSISTYISKTKYFHETIRKSRSSLFVAQCFKMSFENGIVKYSLQICNENSLCNCMQHSDFQLNVLVTTWHCSILCQSSPHQMFTRCAEIHKQTQHLGQMPSIANSLILDCVIRGLLISYIQQLPSEMKCKPLE